LRARDRAIGILLGLLLGIAIVAAFVFLGSEQTIDDPSLSDDDRGAREAPAPHRGTEGPAAEP
jgi:hypothetical protein